MLLTDIRKKLAEVIVTARPDINDYPTVPSVTQVPAVIVAPDPDPTAKFDLSMGLGAVRYFLNLFVLVPYTEMDSNQNLLDELIDPQDDNSVVSIIRDNSDLDGSVDDIRIIDVKNYGGEFKAAEIDHIGAVVSLEVLTC